MSADTQTKLKAFPYDAVDPMGGDHEFYAPDDAVDYVHGVDTFESLVAKVDPSDHFVDVVGFWIVTDKVLDIASSVWPEDGCRNDSATYMCNAAAKRIIKKNALGELTATQYPQNIASL